MNNFKAQVNRTFEFPDLASLELDVVPAGPNKFHILKDGESFHAEIMEVDHSSKHFVIRINGSDYHVQLEDAFDQLVKRLGLEVNVLHKIKNINAPMPGLVLEIQVEEGQVVKRNDPILILEAMKMENILKSPGDGIIEKIMVKEGQAVEKGGLLIKMGDNGVGS